MKALNKYLASLLCVFALGVIIFSPAADVQAAASTDKKLKILPRSATTKALLAKAWNESNLQTSNEVLAQSKARAKIDDILAPARQQLLSISKKDKDYPKFEQQMSQLLIQVRKLPLSQSKTALYEGWAKLFNEYAQMLQRFKVVTRMDHEMLKQEIESLARTQFGKRQETAENRKGIVANTEGNVETKTDGSTENRLVLRPPYGEVFEFEKSNLQRKPRAYVYTEEAPSETRIISINNGFPIGEIRQAKSRIGDFVYIPPGYSEIEVTVHFTEIWSDLNLEGSQWGTTSMSHHCLEIAIHSLVAAVMEPTCYVYEFDVLVGHLPLGIEAYSPNLTPAAPATKTHTSTWPLDGRGGEHLIMAGVGMASDTFGFGAITWNSISARIDSIEINLIR